MSDGKRNGRSFLAAAAVIAGMVAGPFTVWGTLNADAGRQKEKLEQLEKRQAEDRSTFRRDQNEIKQDVKEVKSEVQQIRILLEGMRREGRSR